MDVTKVREGDSESCHSAPSSASGLIPNAVTSVQIEGRDTDICFMDFTDKLFVVISQYKKLGNLILVTKDAAACTDLQEPVYTTKVLFGKDEAEVHAAARHIVTTMQCPKAVLLSLALKEISPAIVRSVAAAVTSQLASVNSPGNQNLDLSAS